MSDPSFFKNLQIKTKNMLLLWVEHFLERITQEFITPCFSAKLYPCGIILLVTKAHLSKGKVEWRVFRTLKKTFGKMMFQKNIWGWWDGRKHAQQIMWTFCQCCVPPPFHDSPLIWPLGPNGQWKKIIYYGLCSSYGAPCMTPPIYDPLGRPRPRRGGSYGGDLGRV